MSLLSGISCQQQEKQLIQMWGWGAVRWRNSATSLRNSYQVLLPDIRPESQAVDQPAGPSPRESLSTWLHEAVSPLAATRASSASQHLVACSKPLA